VIHCVLHAFRIYLLANTRIDVEQAARQVEAQYYWLVLATYSDHNQQNNHWFIERKEEV
jgi:hypothetical protein